MSDQERVNGEWWGRKPKKKKRIQTDKFESLKDALPNQNKLNTM